MAVTKRQQAAWMAELIQIKADADALQRRKHELGKKLGFGTHRHSRWPKLKIVIAAGASGWARDWKGAAKALADHLGVNVENYVSRKRTHRSPSISFQGDVASAINPNLRRVA